MEKGEGLGLSTSPQATGCRPSQSRLQTLAEHLNVGSSEPHEHRGDIVEGWQGLWVLLWIDEASREGASSPKV